MFIGNKFVFFHPPKTGGTTVQHSLTEHMINCFVWELRQIPKTKKITYIDHIAYPDYIHLKELEWTKDFFKFCFVRNPYDKVYSGFVQHKIYTKVLPEIGMLDSFPNLKKDFMEEYEFCKDIDFNEYIKTLPQKIRAYETDDYLFVKFYPMHFWTHYQGQQVMDYIGYLERFDEDLNKVCETLGFGNCTINSKNIAKDPIKCDDPKFLKRSCYKYLSYFNSNSIKLINELYAKDFELLGYPMLDPLDFLDDAAGLKESNLKDAETAIFNKQEVFKNLFNFLEDFWGKNIK